METLTWFGIAATTLARWYWWFRTAVLCCNNAHHLVASQNQGVVRTVLVIVNWYQSAPLEARKCTTMCTYKWAM